MKRILIAVFIALCCISSCTTTSFAARVRSERNTYFIDDAEGFAVIHDGKKSAAREEARKMAMRDAIDKALVMFAGDAEESMKNRVFAKSQSMVRNFKITSETISGDTLYITGSCSVGEKAFDGVLGPEVISMLGNPRVMIIVDGSNANSLENQLMRIFEKAGYLIVDKDQAQTLLALDPKKAFSDPELLAGAAKTIKADIIIVARASSSAAHAQRFGIHMYKPSGSVQIKAVLTKTAYQISSSTISRGTKNWQGSSSAAGILSSGIRQAAEEIIYKIAYKMASAGSLGGITVNINLANASFKDIEKFTAYLKETGQVFERSYSKELAEVDFVSPKNARSVASLISDYEVPSGIIEVDGLTAQTVSARVKPLAPVKEEAPAQAPSVVINVYVDNIKTQQEAERVRTELEKIAGTLGTLNISYAEPALTITITYNGNPSENQDVRAIEKSLKDMNIRIDNTSANSIRGWKEPEGILNRLWW